MLYRSTGVVYAVVLLLIGSMTSSAVLIDSFNEYVGDPGLDSMTPFGGDDGTNQMYVFSTGGNLDDRTQTNRDLHAQPRTDILSHAKGHGDPYSTAYAHTNAPAHTNPDAYGCSGWCGERGPV